jgi:UDP-N-acetyl-D-glucosamine dehydrogenase
VRHSSIDPAPLGDAGAELLQRITERRARAGVVGLGYVGLPLAVEFARAGLAVTGIDLDPRKVAAITAGSSYVPDVPTADVQALRVGGQLSATTDFSALRELDTVNICVPTPLRKTKDPDMSYVVAAAERIAEFLHPGMLVVLESTTYPGTTAELLQPMLEATGLRVGHDVFLAFSPERVDPSNPTFNTRNTPKVVGGVTPACAQLATALYATAIDTIVPVSSTQVAEMVKLLENTFRAVNIGLVNELALMCDRMGIDVWEVVDAARTKPFGFMPFYPGPGLGGHCIPIDPFYLSWKAKEAGFEARFIELAGHVNGAMPHYVADKVAEALNTHRKAVNGSSVLVLGIAYKKNIDDIRESPALDVMHVLYERGARISYADPHAPCLKASDWPGHLDLTAVEPRPDELARHDCVVILTNHDAFDFGSVVDSARLLVDTRNAVGADAGPHVFRLGAPARARARQGQEAVA